MEGKGESNVVNLIAVYILAIKERVFVKRQVYICVSSIRQFSSTPRMLFAKPKTFYMNLVVSQVCSQKSNANQRDFERILSRRIVFPLASKWKRKQTTSLYRPPRLLEKWQDPFYKISCFFKDDMMSRLRRIHYRSLPPPCFLID